MSRPVGSSGEGLCEQDEQTRRSAGPTPRTAEAPSATSLFIRNILSPLSLGFIRKHPEADHTTADGDSTTAGPREKPVAAPTPSAGDAATSVGSPDASTRTTRTPTTLPPSRSAASHLPTPSPSTGRSRMEAGQQTTRSSSQATTPTTTTPTTQHVALKPKPGSGRRRKGTDVGWIGWLRRLFKGDRRQRCLRISGIVAAVLFLLMGIGAILFFTVGLTPLAQSIIESSDLAIDTITVTAPREDGFHLALKGALRRGDFGSGIDVILPALSLDTYGVHGGKERRLGRFTIPTMRLKGSRAPLAFNASFTISDMEAWNEFTPALLEAGGRSRPTWRVASPKPFALRIRLMGIKTEISNLRFDKTLDPNAMGASLGSGLQDFKITDFGLDGSPDISGGAALSLTARFKSPSKLGVDPLGDLDLTLVYANTTVASLRARQPSLRPGQNEWHMDGELATVVAGEGSAERARAISGFVAAAMDGKGMTVNVRGNKTTEPIFATAVEALDLSPPIGALPGLADGGVFKSLTFKGLSIDLSPFDHASEDGSPSLAINSVDSGRKLQGKTKTNVVGLGGTAEVMFDSPLGDNSPIYVDKVSLTASIHDGMVAGEPSVGTLSALLKPIAQPAEPPNMSVYEWLAGTGPYVGPTPPPTVTVREPLSPPSPPLKHHRSHQPSPKPTTHPHPRPTYTSDPFAGRHLAAAAAAPVPLLFDIQGNMTLADGGKPFSTFTSAFLTEPDVYMLIKGGSAQVRLRTALGPLVLPSLTIETSRETAQPLKGFGGREDSKGGEGAESGLAVELTGFEFLSTGKRDALDLEASATLTNPSNTSVSLGDLILEMTLPDASLATSSRRRRMQRTAPVLGYLAAYGVEITPGDTTLSLKGRLRPDDMDLPIVSERLSAYLRGHPLPVRVAIAPPPSGAVWTFADELFARPGWFYEALSSFETITALPPLSELMAKPGETPSGISSDLVQKVTYESLTVTISQTPDRLPLKALLDIETRNPLGGGNTIVETVSLAATISSSEGRPLTRLNTAPQKAVMTESSTGDNLAFRLPYTGDMILYGNGEAVASFATDTLFGKGADSDASSVGLMVNGTVSAVVDTPMGRLTLSDLPVEQVTTLDEGGSLFDSLGVKLVLFQVTKLAINPSSPHTGSGAYSTRDLTMEVLVELSVANPSPFGVVFDKLDLPLHVYMKSLGVGGDLTLIAPTLAPSPDLSRLRLVGRVKADAAVQEPTVKGEMARLANGLFSGGVFPVKVAGRDDNKGAGGKLPPWLRSVVDDLALDFNLDGGLGGSLIDTVGVLNLSVQPVDDDTLVLAGILDVTANSPFGSDVPLTVRKVSIDSTLHFRQGDDASLTLGRMNLPSRAPLVQELTRVNGSDKLILQLQLNDTVRIQKQSAVSSITPFAAFIGALAKDGYVPLDIRGKAGMDVVVSATVTEGRQKKLSDIPLTLDAIPLDFTLTMGEKDGEGISVDLDSFVFEGPSEEGGLDISATAGIVNPSDASLFLGDLSFELYLPAYDDTNTTGDGPTRRMLQAAAASSSVLLGTVEAKSVFLRPGKTPIELTGRLNPAAAALVVVSRRFSEYVRGGDLPVVVKTLPKLREGGGWFNPFTPSEESSREAPPIWLKEALETIAIDTKLPPLSELGGGEGGGDLVSDISVGRFEIDLGGVAETQRAIGVVGEVGTVINNPLGEDTPLTVEAIELAVDLLGDNGQAFGVMKTQPTQIPASKQKVLGNGQIRLDFPLVATLSLTSDGSPFVAFTRDLLERKGAAAPLTIRGRTRVNVQTPMGLLDLDGLPITSKLNLTSGDQREEDALQVSVDDFKLTGDFDNLTAPAIAQSLTDVGRSTSPDGWVAMEIATTLTSRYLITIDFGNLALSAALRYGNQDIGVVETDGPFMLKAGDSQLRLRGYLWRTVRNKRQLSDLLQAAMGGAEGGGDARIQLEGVRLAYPLGSKQEGGKGLPGWVPKVAQVVKFDTTIPSFGSPADFLKPLDVSSVALAPVVNRPTDVDVHLGTNLTFGGPLMPSLTMTFTDVVLGGDLSAGPGQLGALSLKSSKMATGTGGGGVLLNLGGRMKLPEQGDALTAFIEDFLNSTDRQHDLALAGTFSGRVDLGTLGVPIDLTDVALNQTLPLESSLDTFGVEVAGVEFTGEDRNGGLAMDIFINITNPSPAQVTLGDLRLNVFLLPVEGEPVDAPMVPIGHVDVRQYVLKRNEHESKCTGILMPAAEDMDAVSARISRFLQGKTLSVRTVLDETYKTSNTPPPWLQNVIHGLDLKSELPSLASVTAGADSKLVDSLVINDFYLRLDEVEDGAEEPAIPLKGVLEVVVNNPLGSATKMSIESLGMSLSLLDGKAEDAPVLGRLEIPPVEIKDSRFVNGDDDYSQIALTIPLSTPLMLDDVDNTAAFAKRLLSAVESGAASNTTDALRVIGGADAVVSTPMGRLSLTDLQVDEELPLTGPAREEEETAVPLFEVQNFTVEEFLFLEDSGSSPITPDFPLESQEADTPSPPLSPGGDPLTPSDPSTDTSTDTSTPSEPSLPFFPPPPPPQPEPPGLPNGDQFFVDGLFGRRDRATFFGPPRALQRRGQIANGMRVSLGLAVRNPAPIGLALGDLKWSVRRDDVTIGELRTMDVILAPGSDESAVKVRGTLQAPPGVDSEAFFTELVGEMFGDDQAALQLTPRPMREGAPDWLTRIVNGVSVSVPVNGILSSDSLVASLDVSSLSLIPLGGQEVQLKGSLTITANNPLGANVDIGVSELGLSGTLYGPSSKPICVLRVPSQTAVVLTGDNLDVEPNQIVVGYDFEGTLTMEEDGEAFADLVESMLSKGPSSAARSLAMQLMGTSAVTVISPLGTLPLDKVRIDNAMPLLKEGSEAIDLSNASLGDIKFGSPPRGQEGVTFTTNLEVDLPASFPLSLDFGSATFDLTFTPPVDNATRAVLGDITLTPLALKRGTNKIPVEGSLVPPTTDSDRAGLNSFVSRYVAGKPAALKVVGKSIYLEDTLPSRASPKWLQKVAAALVVEMDVPGGSKAAFGDISVKDLGITARRGSDDGVNNAIRFEAVVSAELINPLGPDSPVTVDRAAVAMKLMRGDAILGSLDSGLLEAGSGSSRGSKQMVTLPFKKTELVFPDRGRAFGALAADLLKSDTEGESPSLTIDGTIAAYVSSDLGPLHLTELPLSTNVTLSGLDIAVESDGGLREWGLTDASDGFQLDATVAFDVGGSASSSTGASMSLIDLGAVMLDAYMGGKRLLRLTAPSLRLVDGSNTLKILGQMTPKYTDIPTAASLMSSVVSGDSVKLTVRGAEGDDSNSPEWVKAAVSALELEVPVKITAERGGGGREEGESASPFLRDVEVGGIVLDFVRGKDPFLEGSVVVEYALPKGVNISFDVNQLSLATSMSRAPISEVGAGKPTSLPTQVGRLSVTTADVSIPGDSKFRAVFDNGVIKVKDGERAAFEDFLSAVLYDSGATRLYLSGEASLVLVTRLGQLSLDGVKLDLSQDLKHLGGIDSDSVSLGTLQVSEGRADGLIMSTEIGLKNAASFGARLGDVKLDLYVAEKDLPERPRLRPPPRNGGGLLAPPPRPMPIPIEQQAPPLPEDGDLMLYVGQVTVRNLTLLPGKESKMPIDVLVFPTREGDSAQGPRRLISQYVSRKGSATLLKGRQNSTRVPLVNKALSRWESGVAISGAKESFMQGAELDLASLPLFGRGLEVTARLIIKNPFPVDVKLLYVDSTLFKDGVKIGQTTIDWRNDPMVIPGESTTKTDAYKLNVGAVTPQALTTFWQSLQGYSTVSAEGIVEVVIGEYGTLIDYNEATIPTTF
ncbi:unnamed protein product [Vitrella brassicaformis CCMP3155]|uniref:Uncharacterized protein n=8 Tax=Vitrella brassicaformis TaxID=1169539 RepID=A0A0G4F0A0_VITBC|nr:unnamed protein product [Vitrella brassicaformis CCMP3155]|eukprot:CEM05095.1 unnamed protein product [Vitrella brassicaformis CCMP3155]